jgi:hypothetical protein
VKRGGPIRAVSRRRQSEASAWAKTVKFVRWRDHDRCVVGQRRGQPEKCWGPIDPHHVRPVGRGGERLDPMNVILACRNCHSWLHDHPVEATALGVLA